MKNSVITHSTGNQKIPLKLLVIGILLFLTTTMQAQVAKTLHATSLPAWCNEGQSDTRFILLTDVNSFYDVNSGKFIYIKGNVWVHRKNLPKQFRGYDLCNGNKIMIAGQINFDKRKVKYAKVVYCKDQKINDKRSASDRDNMLVDLKN